MKLLLLAALSAIVPIGTIAAANLPQNVHDHTVDCRERRAYSLYQVRQQDRIGVLNTHAGGPFIAGSGQLLRSRRHAGDLWRITVNTAALVRAESPPIPAGDHSWVYVIGQFQGCTRGGRGFRGEAPSGDDDEEEPDTGPAWESILEEDCDHLVLVHQYLDDEANNKDFLAAGTHLANQVYENAGTAHLVTIGVDADIPDATGLAAHLMDLGIAAESIVTVDTIGHGGSWNVEVIGGNDYDSTAVLAGSSTRDDDGITRPDDVPDIDENEWLASWRAFLKPRVFVSVFHCFSADPKPNDPHGPAVPSVAERWHVQLGSQSLVLGVEGTCYSPGAGGSPRPSGPVPFIYFPPPAPVEEDQE